MGETIKDKHRITERDSAAALPPDSKLRVELAVALVPPAQPVPPPACPAWVPWEQHRL